MLLLTLAAKRRWSKYFANFVCPSMCPPNEGWSHRCGLLNSLHVALTLILCTYVQCIYGRCNSLHVKLALKLVAQFLTHGARTDTLYMCTCIIEDPIP